MRGSLPVFGSVALALAFAGTAQALPDTLPINKCLAGKISKAGGSAAARTRCRAKAAVKGVSDPACAQKSAEKLTSIFQKLEAKFPSSSAASCITFGDLPMLEERIADHTAQVDGITGAAGKCDAVKMGAVARYVGSVAKCAGKAAAGAANVDPECLAKAASKLSGSLDRASRLSDCSSAGSQEAEIQEAGDLFVDRAICLFTPSCPPFIVDAQAIDIRSTSASLSVTSDEDGTVFALPRPAAMPAPSVAEVMTGGSPIVAGIPAVLPFSGLSPETQYVAWVVTQDGDGNTQDFPMAVPFDTNPPNQPPVFTMGHTLFADRWPGVTSFPGWLTGLAPGPSFEAWQDVTITVEVIAGSACDPFGPDCLATVFLDPQIDPATGTLSFDTAQWGDSPDGAFDLRVTVTDNGGTENGGVDTASGVFRVNVNRYPTTDNLFVEGLWGSSCIPVTMTATDPEGDPLGFDFVTLPIHGKLFDLGQECSPTPRNPIDGIVSCTVCYVPTDRRWKGVDTFTFRAYDAFGLGSIATGAIVVKEF